METFEHSVKHPAQYAMPQWNSSTLHIESDDTETSLFEEVGSLPSFLSNMPLLEEKITSLLDAYHTKHQSLLDSFVQNAFQNYVVEEQGDFDETEDIFHSLALQWREETKFVSSTTDLILHPAYQQIIGLGPSVVPYLLNDLQNQSSPPHWFWALQSITRENPVSPNDLGRVRKMAEAWINWGRQRGYI